MNDVFVRVIELPSTIPALVALDPDGNYNIYINARLSHDEALRAYEHEKRHIFRNDFFRDAPIGIIEKEAEK